MRVVRVTLLVVLLAGLLGSCMDEPPLEEVASVPASATRTSRPARTRTPTATARATPRSVAAEHAGATWTILVYLDGDNNLEDSALTDFTEMARVGTSDEVNIVVQLDRIASDEDWDDTTYGDWTTVKRFLIEQRKRPTKSSQLADLGELNMGDPETLTDFIDWGVTDYPAEHYALIFWDHGASWPGVANDDTSGGDPITLPELTQALADATERTGVERFDLIGFDTCLMSQLDVLEAIAPYGDIAVGSADLEPGDGWAWEAWLGQLVDDPELSKEMIATQIVEDFVAFFEGRDEPSVTLAAFDLHQVPVLRERLNDLVGLLLEDIDGSYRAIGKARSYAETYAADDEDLAPIDLGHFAKLLMEEATDERLIAAAQALDQAITQARIAEGHGEAHPNATGVSIYFPRKSKHYDDEYTDASMLSQQTRWAEFLQAFYTAGKPTAGRTTVAQPTAKQSRVSTARPLALRAEVEGDNTAFVYSFVGTIDQNDPATLQVQSMDYLYPPGAVAHGEAPSWPAGKSDVQLRWPATAWYVSNGDDVRLVPFSPTDYGSNIYSVDGIYTTSDTGDQLDVSLEFEVVRGYGRLLHIWGFDEGGGGEPQPFELDPDEGATFIPYIDTYTAVGDEIEEGVVEGEPIVFGATPLVAAEGPAPSGDYVVGLLVENVAGDISDQYVDITVNNEAAAPEQSDFIPAGLEGGTQAGTLVYDDPDLGVRFEYPQSWELADTGSDKIVLYEPAATIATYLSLDVAMFDEEPDVANQAMLEELLAAAQDEEDFEQDGDMSAIEVAGLDGSAVDYQYSGEDETIQVSAVAITSPANGRTYLLTMEMPESEVGSKGAIFDQVLATFQIGGE